MRKSCLDCARKHVAQAEHTLHEWWSDMVKYRTHFWYAIGHLAEAEAELMECWPEHAFLIRQHRILLIAEPTYKMPTNRILEALCNEEEKMQGSNVSESNPTRQSVLSCALENIEPENPNVLD